MLRDHDAGHTANHLPDGAAAIDHFTAIAAGTQRRPDVVLLDLKLPKVDGLEVLSFVKTHDRLQAIPVVVLTTSDAETDRTQAYHSHANSYIVKPVSFEKFEAMVAELSTYWGGWNEATP